MDGLGPEARLRAHLLRDAACASEDGDGGFAPGFCLLLLRAMAIGKRRAALKDSTLARYHAGLQRQLDRLLSGPMPERPAACRLFRTNLPLSHRLTISTLTARQTRARLFWNFGSW